MSIRPEFTEKLESMQYLKVLDAILADMQAEISENGDAQTEHMRGDQLLVELIAVLAVRESHEVQRRIEQILEAWKKIEKWYS